MHGLQILRIDLLFLRTIILACLLITFKVSGDGSVLITENTEELNLITVSRFYEDKNGLMTLDELEKPEYQQQFQNVEQDVINAGITNSVIWLTFELRYLSYLGEELGLWLLEIDYPALDLVTLYVQEVDGSFQAVHTGDKYPFDVRSIAHPGFLFPIEIRTGETLKFYLRVETSGSMQIPMKLWTPLAYLERSNQQDIFEGVIAGILLVMFFYNLVLLLHIRDMSYLYYTIYLAGFILYQASVNGLGLAILWPDFPVINSAAPFFMSVVGVSGLLFARSFLKLNEKSARIDRFYILMILAGVLILPVSLLAQYNLAAKLVMIQVLPTFPVLIATGLYFWITKKDQAAKLFTLAFAVLLVGGGAHGLMLLGELPHNSLTIQAVPLGVAIEVTLLSLALASRIRRLKEDKMIAERKSITQLESVNVRLQESNRLKAEFLHGISHELRTPLNGMTGALELISGDLLAKDQQELLEAARTSSNEMNEIIRNLLSLTEFQSGGLAVIETSFNLRRQLEIFAEKFRRQANAKGLEFDVIVDSSVPGTLYSDPEKIMRSMSYLVDNAIKFTREGDVRIRGKVEECDNEKECLLVLTVTDTGIGVNDEQKKTIYQAFQQADGSNTRQYNGLGLGLAICQQLVHLMGGDIRHYPETPTGTSFELAFTCRRAL